MLLAASPAKTCSLPVRPLEPGFNLSPSVCPGPLLLPLVAPGLTILTVLEDLVWRLLPHTLFRGHPICPLSSSPAKEENRPFFLALPLCEPGVFRGDWYCTLPARLLASLAGTPLPCSSAAGGQEGEFFFLSKLRLHFPTGHPRVGFTPKVSKLPGSLLRPAPNLKLEICSEGCPAPTLGRLGHLVVEPPLGHTAQACPFIGGKSRVVLMGRPVSP